MISTDSALECSPKQVRTGGGDRLAPAEPAVRLMVPPDSSPLSRPEAEQLVECERVIGAGFKAFYEVAAALVIIQTKRLYRAQFPSFEEYCRHRWGLSRTHAYRLIGAAGMFERLLTLRDITPPTNERQIRPLVGLEPKFACKVWRRAHALAGEAEPTSGDVTHARDQLEDSLNAHAEDLTRTPETSNPYAVSALHSIQRLRKCLTEKHIEEALVVIAKLRLLLERMVCQDTIHSDAKDDGSDPPIEPGGVRMSPMGDT